MRVGLQCGILMAAIALVCCADAKLLPAVFALDRPDKAKSATSELQTRFDHETNSVHKAKLFEKLSDAQLAEVRHASQSSDYNAVGTIMEKYRDNARAAVDALKKEHPNADHQLNGYKQLQIHIRLANGADAPGSPQASSAPPSGSALEQSPGNGSQAAQAQPPESNSSVPPNAN